MKSKVFRRVGIFIFVCIIFNNKAFVQPSEMLIDHIGELYSFNFTKTDSGNLKPYEQDVITAYHNWYKFLLYPDGDSVCEQLLKSLDILSHSTDLISDQVSKWFFSIYFEQYKSRVYLFKGEHLKAYKTSINLFGKINDIDTSLLDADDRLYYQFLEASRLYFMGYLQDKYIFLRPFFDGDAKEQISKGLELLNIVVKGENIFLKTEASYLLMKINKELQDTHNFSLMYAEWLTSIYPRNIIFQLENLRCLAEIEGKETLFYAKKKEISGLLQILSLNQNELTHLTNQLNGIQFNN